MVKYVIQQFPNLVFTKEVLATVRSDKLSSEYKLKVFEAFAYLDYFGLDQHFMGDRISARNESKELVVKLNSRTTCAFTIVQDEEVPSKFEIIHYADNPEGLLY